MRKLLSLVLAVLLCLAPLCAAHAEIDLFALLDALTFGDTEAETLEKLNAFGVTEELLDRNPIYKQYERKPGEFYHGFDLDYETGAPIDCQAEDFAAHKYFAMVCLEGDKTAGLDFVAIFVQPMKHGPENIAHMVEISKTILAQLEERYGGFETQAAGLYLNGQKITEDHLRIDFQSPDIKSDDYSVDIVIIPCE